MAITIDVITKVVDSSLKGSSDTIGKHFSKTGKDAGEQFAKALTDGMSKSPELQRALDKAADATGKLRVEQEKLNAVNEKGRATDAQKIAAAERLEKAKREEARAVAEAARAYEQANTSAGGMLSTLSSLAGGTRFGGLISDAETLSSKFGGIGLAAGGAALGFTAIAAGAVALGSKLYDLGRQWDDISDSITARTGKIGADLDAVVNQVSRAAYSTAASTGELGNIAGQVVQSLRASGDQVGDMTKKIAELNNLTGDQTNIRQLGEVYRVFGVDANEQVGVLNQLYGIFQQTGVPVNELIATLQKSGPILQEFGMDFTQAAGFMAVFERAGVRGDDAMKGLRFALKNLAEAGVDPKTGLQQIVTEIENLIAAQDNIGARNLAEERFGKGFAEILQAIKDNRLELDALPSAVNPLNDKIDEATKATEDFTEKWQKFKNMFEIGLKPAAAGFFDWLNDRMAGTLDYMQQKIIDTTEAWNGLFNGSFWNDSALGRLLSKLGLGPGDSGSWLGGGVDGLDGAGQFGNTAMSPRLNDSQGGGVRSQPSVVAGANAVLSVFGDQIRGTIGGSRSYNSAPGTHEVGLAMDIPIGPDQMALGDQINAWLQANADKLNIKYTIWRDQGRYAGNPNPSFTSPGHFNHIDVQFKDGTVMSASTNNTGILGNTAGRPIGPTSPGGTAPSPFTPSTTTAPGSPTAPVSPSTQTPMSFTPGNFPAAGDVAPASPNTTPVQMVPSPFGPGYQPVPAGSTPGFNQFGKPGFYLPDPDQIANASRAYENAVDNATESAKAIEEAKKRQAEAAEEAAKIEQDLYSTSEDRKRAQDRVAAANAAVDRAIKSAERANESAEQAEENLAEAKRGSFREAQKAAEAKKQKKRDGLDELGFPLADDFGLSEGLPGIAKWLTTFAANLAFAPMNGALGAIAGGGAGQTGYGMFGMMGANNIAAGLSPLGLSGGSIAPNLVGSVPTLGASFPTRGSSPVPAAMGPAPLGGGLGSTLPGLPGATPGPGTAQTSMAPSAGPGGGGFAGIGGLPMAAISSAISAAGMGADVAGGAMGGGTAAAAAAQMAIQLANRTAGYIGQAAAIGVGGLMETFLPHNSAVADPGKSWIGRIAAGFAGARPALPNVAGGEQQPDQQNPAGDSQPPQTPEEAAKLAQQTGGGQGGGPMVNVENLNNYSPDGGQSVANQIGRMQMASYASGGPR